MNPSYYHSVTGAIAIVAFWTFVTASVIVAAVADSRKRKIEVEALRIAIEHGEKLDASVLDRLLSSFKPPQPKDPERIPVYVQLSGIVTTAAGVGIAFLSLFIARIVPIALYPIMGAGVLTLCIGIGLLLGAKQLKRSPIFRGMPAERV